MKGGQNYSTLQKKLKIFFREFSSIAIKEEKDLRNLQNPISKFFLPRYNTILYKILLQYKFLF